MLGQFLLKGPLLLASLVEPGLRLSNARLEIHLRLVHRCRPGLNLVQTDTVERLEFSEVGPHSAKKLLFWRTITANARLINHLEPGGGKHLAVENFPFGGRPA